MRKTNNIFIPIIIIVLAIALIVGTIMIFVVKNPATDNEDISSSTSQVVSSGEEPTNNNTNPSNIPDVNANQSSPEKPYDEVEWSGMSPTTLTEEEVLTEVKMILDGLLVMNEDAISRVSARSTGGEHNPLRVMLNAALADKTMLAAFKNMGSVSSYKILSLTPSSTNVYTATIACSTPYMANYAAILSASDQIVQIQELVLFRANGAAQAISEMNMSEIAMNTDIVELAIIVEDDVPVLYHSNSYIYGSNIPQYAFLWGGIDFKGTQSGDLLLTNYFGATTEMSLDEFKVSKQGTLIVQYLDSVLNTIQSTNMDAALDLEVGGDRLATHWGLRDTYPEYLKMFEEYPLLRTDTMSRLRSLEYSITPYLLTEKESGAELYAIAITYSVVDPITKERIYNTRFYYVNKSSLSFLNQNDGSLINNMVDQIIEDILGGNAILMVERLRLLESIQG